MSGTIDQLVFTKERELRWQKVSAPSISDRSSALLRPIAVARSDLEVRELCQADSSSISLKHLRQEALTGLAKRIHLERYTTAAPVGQQCIAEIVETGPDVAALLPRGKRVVVTASLSCGACSNCLAGLTAQCLEYDETHGFGSLDKPAKLGGLLCDLVRVPNAVKTLVPLPDNLDPVQMSSAGADLADAWCALMPILRKRKSARILFLGGAARSTTLYAVALAARHPVEQLDYLDQSAERVAIAGALGANAAEKTLRRHTGHYDVVISGNTESGIVRQALQHLLPGGIYLQLQPHTLKEEKIPLDLLYRKNLTLVAAKPHVLANLPGMLEYFSANTIDLKLISTHIGAFSEAHQHYPKNTTKVVVHRPQLY